MSDGLIAPHGGELVSLLVDRDRAAELKEASLDWPSVDLTARQLCDLELLANGSFSPLRGFQTEAEYESVLADMRLTDGLLWPIPITLDVSESTAEQIETGGSLALRDPEGLMLGVIHVEDVWSPDRGAEIEAVFGTTDTGHPGVDHLLHHTGSIYVGGAVEVTQLPVHYDFRDLRLSPQETRAAFAEKGWNRIVAYHTRGLIHRRHLEVTTQAAGDLGASLLLHPVVGIGYPGDIDHYARVRTYEAVLGRYPPATTMLALLPMAMRLAGPRETLWHAIVEKNHGVTHMIVGAGHGGPRPGPGGQPFYPTYGSQELLAQYEDEIQLTMVAVSPVIDGSGDSSAPGDDPRSDSPPLRQSGEMLVFERGSAEGFTFPEVVAEMRKSHPPRSLQGLTVFLTGLSGSGKSTVANALRVKLRALGGRSVSLLDGDVVRKSLSSGLGFSKQDRDLNIERIGYVASEITKHGGVAICCPIAPYDDTRKRVRRSVERYGGFVLVHVSTPLDVCEARDSKGLYAKARAGLIEGFTGVSDPYEEPDDAELVIDTTDIGADAAADRIVEHLREEGYLPRS